ARHPRVGDDLSLLGTGAVHPARDAVRAEQPHQVVLARQAEHALSRTALTARAAAQLAVDAPRLVPLGAHDDQAARRVLLALQPLDLLRTQVGFLDLLPERRLVGGDTADLTLLDAGAEFDVGAAARHVGGDGDGGRLPRLRHDLGLALVVLGVQHFVPEAAALQHARQRLRDVHAHGADQHRQAALVLAVDFV